MTPPLRPLPELTDAERGTAAGMAKILASQVGYREGTNNDTAFGVWYGNNHAPWCAQFQSWAAATAGVGADVILKHQYTPTGYNWFKARGQIDPRGIGQPGDLGYVYYQDLGRVGHVFFVERVTVTAQGVRIYHTLEGNTNDSGSSQGVGVFRLIRAQTGYLYFARPAYHASEEDWFDMASQADLEAAVRKVLNEGKGYGQPSWATTSAATLAGVQGVTNGVIKLMENANESRYRMMLDDGNPAQYLVDAATRTWIKSQDDLHSLGAEDLPNFSLPATDTRWSYRLNGEEAPGVAEALAAAGGG